MNYQNSLPNNINITHWYNVISDLPVMIPPAKNSEKGNEIELLNNILPRNLYEFNNSTISSHKIPEDVLENYIKFNRPTPLLRAKRFEEYLNTNSHIYFKREDVITTGSFKINTALAQASQAKKEGYAGVVTETGAGQWGLALSAACALYDLKCKIFMARCSYEHKSVRRKLMEVYGAEVFASPSNQTESGKDVFINDNLHPGSIGMSISEAVEFANLHKEYAYVAGSNFLFVYIHQSIIGLETARQLKEYGEEPNVIVACLGGGSNFSGFALPLVFGSHSFNNKPTMIACESTSIPRLTKGKYEYDHGDPAGLTPLIKSYSLGRDFVPPPTHVGGLRQHNGSPIIGALYSNGYIKAKAYNEKEIFDVGLLIARLEGIFPAPESCHAICGTIEAIQNANKSRKKIVVVCCISGSGTLDIEGYISNLK